MAELLIRTVDKPSSGSVYVDRHRLGRGDVVAIMPDGHPWSEAERHAPFWRILKLPRVNPAQLTQLINGDVGYGNEEAEKLNRVLQRRAFKIDFSALTELLSDPVKLLEIATQPSKALAHALNLVTAKPVLIDPAIVGPPQDRVKVIG